MHETCGASSGPGVKCGGDVQAKRTGVINRGQERQKQADTRKEKWGDGPEHRGENCDADQEPQQLLNHWPD